MLCQSSKCQFICAAVWFAQSFFVGYLVKFILWGFACLLFCPFKLRPLLVSVFSSLFSLFLVRLLSANVDLFLSLSSLSLSLVLGTCRPGDRLHFPLCLFIQHETALIDPYLFFSICIQVPPPAGLGRFCCCGCLILICCFLRGCWVFWWWVASFSLCLSLSLSQSLSVSLSLSFFLSFFLCFFLSLCLLALY